MSCTEEQFYLFIESNSKCLENSIQEFSNFKKFMAWCLYKLLSYQETGVVLNYKITDVTAQNIYKLTHFINLSNKDKFNQERVYEFFDIFNGEQQHYLSQHISQFNSNEINELNSIQEIINKLEKVENELSVYSSPNEHHISKFDYITKYYLNEPFYDIDNHKMVLIQLMLYKLKMLNANTIFYIISMLFLNNLPVTDKFIYSLMSLTHEQITYLGV